MFLPGLSSVAYHAHFTQQGTFRVYLYLGGANGERLFEILEQDKDALQRHFGETLQWQRGKTGSASLIGVYYPDGAKITDDQAKLENLGKWAYDQILHFHGFVKPRLVQSLATFKPL